MTRINTLKAAILTTLALGIAGCGSDESPFIGSGGASSATNVISAGYFSIGFSEPAPSVLTLANPPVGSTASCADLTAISGDITSTITITAADNQNALVSSGTVYIKVEWGTLDNNYCVLQNGQCSVEWSSSTNIDPITSSGSTTACFSGTGTIDVLTSATAWTYGEEYFQDNDGDNKLSNTENFTDIDEPYLDRNDNGTYESPPDNLTSADTNGVHDGPDGLFNGPSCDTTTRADCAGAQLIPIYEQAFMVIGQ